MSAGRRVAVTVAAASAGERLDRFLATVRGLGTRSRVKQLIGAARARVDGVARKASFKLRPGMRVEVDLPAREPSTLVPEAVPLAVLYEDETLVAIDKPPGMATHPAPGSRRGTVVHALLHHLGTLAGVGPADRPGIVHRLDKDTSGVLLIAKTPEALETLARQFRARTIEKRYTALVHGSVRSARGTIDRPIGRDGRDRKRMSVRSVRGRPAVTAWMVRERFPGATLLDVAPKTGRTHQIRVHLASTGHPIVGDAIYGGRRRAASAPAGVILAACPRQALHAARLTFTHPATGAPMTIEAPLPVDLAEVVDALRKVARIHGNSPKLP